MTPAALLTGEDLTLADVWEVAVGGASAELADSARERMRAARELVEGARGEHTYGINTGFGRFVSAHIPDELAEELQLRLLRSHACGVGMLPALKKWSVISMTFSPRRDTIVRRSSRQGP